MNLIYHQNKTLKIKELIF